MLKTQKPNGMKGIHMRKIQKEKRMVREILNKICLILVINYNFKGMNDENQPQHWFS